MKIVIVGGGMQGRVIAENLICRPEEPDVVVVDITKPDKLPDGVGFKQASVLDETQAKQEVKDADAVILAVPSGISHVALLNLINAGRPIVDVSFTPDPPLEFSAAAKATGACCVVDCGISPGLSNILLGRAIAELGGADSLKILVGGLPQDPPPIFRHAVYFNPNDLIAEYIRPARARKAGLNVAPLPLDVPEVCHVDSELGALELFVSDGLRSLLTSYPDVRDMAELTIRWPGHLQTMKTLRELGLFDEPVASGAIAKVLLDRYPAHQYPDYLLLLIEVRRQDKYRSWRLLDRCTSGVSAMSRTTGFTTAAVAMLLARKQFTKPGVHPPERLGAETNLAQLVVDDLAERGINVMELADVTAR